MEIKKIKKLLVFALYVFLLKLILVSMVSFSSKQRDKDRCHEKLKNKIHKPYIKDKSYEYSAR